MAEEKEYKGFNGTVVLQENALVIKRGKKGFFAGGFFSRGDKTIPYKSIVAVQFKKPSLSVGYIQFSLLGGSEAKAGVFQAARDENTVTFQTQQTTQKFEELKKIVEERMGQSGTNKSTHSSLDELAKLGDLKDKGVITEEEFRQKKKQLLGV